MTSNQLKAAELGLKSEELSEKARANRVGEENTLLKLLSDLYQYKSSFDYNVNKDLIDRSAKNYQSLAIGPFKLGGFIAEIANALGTGVDPKLKGQTGRAYTDQLADLFSSIYQERSN